MKQRQVVRGFPGYLTWDAINLKNTLSELDIFGQ